MHNYDMIIVKINMVLYFNLKKSIFSMYIFYSEYKINIYHILCLNNIYEKLFL
jgi:hypothetical protein